MPPHSKLQPLYDELERLRNSGRLDGWVVMPHYVGSEMLRVHGTVGRLHRHVDITPTAWRPDEVEVGLSNAAQLLAARLERARDQALAVDRSLSKELAEWHRALWELHQAGLCIRSVCPFQAQGCAHPLEPGPPPEV